MSNSYDNQLNQVSQSLYVDDSSLQNIPGFPYEEYNNRLGIYRELESWYSGLALDQEQLQAGIKVEKYPVKLNPIRGACMKHAYTLFGEYPEDSRPLVSPYIRREKDKDKDLIGKVIDLLNTIWYDNSGRSLQMKNGLYSQIYGGCIFAISYVPEDTLRPYPFKIEAIHPTNFCGELVAGDMFKLRETWIVREISKRDAREVYGFSMENESITPKLVEHWTLDKHQIFGNGQIVTRKIGDVTKTYNEDNPWGFVPVVYIPHIPSIGGIYGDSVITEALKGIEKEINLRVADFGDAVSDDAHRYAWIRNNSGKPDVGTVGTIPTVFLGSNASITGKESAPEMGMLGEVRSSTPMATLTDELYKHFRRESLVPAVADGEDEGSQRSSLTLTTRMFPLVSHARQERVLWGEALSLVNKMLLNMVLKKAPGTVSASALKLRIESKFAPVLPREKTDIVNELVSRASANLGDIETLLMQLDDIEDPAEEVEKIKEWLKFTAELEASKYANMNQDQSGNPDAGKTDPLTKSKGPTGEKAMNKSNTIGVSNAKKS
jgi:hypothetical protein